RALHAVDAAERLAASWWPEAFAGLIRIQLKEPMAERALRAEIEPLTPVPGAVSQAVQAQYEENPFPRWVRAGRAPRAAPLPKFIASLGGEAPTDPAFSTPDVLVAGCGTGRHPVIAASIYENASILAVDLSLTSLAYAL